METCREFWNLDFGGGDVGVGEEETAV